MDINNSFSIYYRYTKNILHDYVIYLVHTKNMLSKSSRLELSYRIQRLCWFLLRQLGYRTGLAWQGPKDTTLHSADDTTVRSHDGQVVPFFRILI